MKVVVMYGGNPSTSVKNHFRRNKDKYLRIGLIGAATLLSMEGMAEASNLDVSAGRMYAKIRNIGKWVILIKGAIVIIQDVIQEDYGSAKKHLLGYLSVYATLWLLPWGMEQVEEMFEGGL